RPPLRRRRVDAEAVPALGRVVERTRAACIPPCGLPRGRRARGGTAVRRDGAERGVGAYSALRSGLRNGRHMARVLLCLTRLALDCFELRRRGSERDQGSL